MWGDLEMGMDGITEDQCDGPHDFRDGISVHYNGTKARICISNEGVESFDCKTDDDLEKIRPVLWAWITAPVTIEVHKALDEMEELIVSLITRLQISKRMIGPRIVTHDEILKAMRKDGILPEKGEDDGPPPEYFG